jgi:DNA repair exonuclease SbcCD ATPase subunit
MPLSHIFHLSDLHIRNGDNTFSRYEEYSQVFKETIISLNSNIEGLKLTFEDFVIIITGDIFHNKNVIGNYGLFIYREFVQSLSKIGRLYIISGNHDYDQSDVNKPSLVYSSTFDIPNVFVLNTSTSFVIDDVGFSFVSIDKTLDKYRNSGRIQDLPAFPIIADTVKYKVALFHGTFASAKLCNGKSIEETFNPYPLEWVKEFDYVLLGDIHKRQVFNYKKKTICGYSGSLIQQNFGEDIIHHGYLIWNLRIADIKEVNIYNDIGYINIIEDVSHNIFIRTNGGYTELLETYIKDNINYFPKNLEIKAFSNVNYQSLSIILNSFNISFHIVSKLDSLNNINNNINNQGSLSALSEQSSELHNVNEENQAECSLDTDYLLDYFKKLLSPDKYKILLKIIKNKETLLFDINKYPEDLHSECIKRNKDLEPIINSCNIADDTQSLKKSFLIKYLEWEGLLCYENKCWINFKDLDAKTFMIKGSNGTGKSAIYDILQLAIWATNNKFDTYSAGFINHNKDSGYTIIDIEVDNITYRIKRDFCKKKGTFKINNKSSILYRHTDLSKLVILKKDSACNAEVKSLFGDMNTFLSTSMITQSIDNDILALNYKDTLATIDKSHNIQFIYHLYNLFKTAINKYKDFGKVIQSKKEVYEKLLFNGVNSDVNEEVILKLTEELRILNINKNKRLKAYNNINVDINNPVYLAIVDTDYTSLIGDILANEENTILSKEVYEKYKERHAHFKYLYCINDDNNSNLKELRKLAKLYSQQLEDEFNKLSCECVNKPCDISYIRDEEIALREYINMEDSESGKSGKCCESDESVLMTQKSDLVKNKDILSDLISNKPNKILRKFPCRDIGTCKGTDINIENLTSIILKIYGGDMDVFNDFISSNTKPSSASASTASASTASAAVSVSLITEPISIEHFQNITRNKETLEDDIVNIKNMIASLEKDFNSLFSNQQRLKYVNVPREPLTYKQFKTALSVAKELKQFNIDTLNTQIAEDEVIMKEYHQKEEEINKLDIDIECYNKELQVFSVNDEYNYNPECCICCNRPWVSRIKEIGIIVNTLKIARNNIDYSENDFAIVRERFEENKIIKDRYYLLTEWYHYYKFKEAYDKITKELNIIISSKNTLYDRLNGVELELQSITVYTEYFISYSFMLYEEINNIRLYETYKVWESSYNKTKMRVEELEKTIHFNEIIKPRIAKYRELKRCYDDWVSYERNKKIIDGYHYCRLNKIIEVNDLYKEYQNNEMLKPLIKQKIELHAFIENKDRVIKKLNDDLVKYTTIYAYNNDNKNNYSSLLVVESDINNIIEVLDTILINFQSFRKELYENFILNRLVKKTNKIIKTLCHANTKPFKLNYNVDISNDMVHIYWLIHNDNIAHIDSGSGSSSGGDSDKQYISVSQASGFQRFAISLALRMSLYFNNYDVLCRQLFIDEGFINFDKNNLSVVPVFLKSLLHYFNTIVILSHIDIIQDSVDETAEICFDKANGVSMIVYN